MAMRLFACSRRPAAQAISSPSIRCCLHRLVIPKRIIAPIASSRFACCTRNHECSKHDMISRHYSSSSLRLASCKHEGCGIRAGFGWATDGKALYCSFHKRPDMVDIIHKRCAHPGCDSLNPTFGYSALAGSPKKGGTSKLLGMVDAIIPRCEHEGCSSINPAFDVRGSRIGRYCEKHRQENMVDVINRRCSSHKLPGMVDVRTRRCAYEGCDSLNPIFDLPGIRKGRFCDKHRTADMVDVKNRKCGQESCDVVNPSFGFLVARGWHSANIKLSGIRIRKYAKCEYERCKNIARFGVVLGEPLYCSIHKLSQMTDVVSNRCFEHKLEGMVNFKKKCEQKGCQTLASFGMPGGVCQYCILHKLEGMIQYRGWRVKKKGVLKA